MSINMTRSAPSEKPNDTYISVAKIEAVDSCS
ncbi:hypothetical protein T4B_14219 [Trichinella pseudospiralis]|uniref:Uncharacterized protein n=1 Tax=Trichinella pseudospiralis TaxID=6337 RepID=A0A0V1GDH4_TRIPS|nr:hypothetical protein T4B_14219 [Trichinella pseudospiralis]